LCSNIEEYQDQAAVFSAEHSQSRRIKNKEKKIEGFTPDKK